MTMNLGAMHRLLTTRRHFFGECGYGVGKVALASLMAQGLVGQTARGATAAAGLLSPKPAPYTPRAKRVIHLFMAGAPSHLDMFDYKPKLAELEGKPLPPEVIKGQRYAFIRPDAAVLGPRFKFKKCGQSGAEISEALPHLAGIVDDIAIVRSMYTDQFNHAPAELFVQTGSPQPGRPSIGAWVTYGLGSETSDLPAFVVLSSGGGASGGAASWSSGFLPTIYAGVPFRSQGDPIINLSSPAGIDAKLQRDSLDLIGGLNRMGLEATGDPEINTRIAQYEMAYRLQSSAPELMNIGTESKATLEMYGAEPGKASFANNCLLARRMIERGVRYVNIYHTGWDGHSDVAGNVKNNCGITDKASAALVKDLKQRGLLDETLVVWGGEFGRTPMVENNTALGRSQGRDHHPQAFTVWMAGGGVKPGISLGATDELGFHVVEDPVHIHDLQATMLHLLGINHQELTFTFQGRKFRLTDVHGRVVGKLLA
jgi:hypothetical protein